MPVGRVRSHRGRNGEITVRVGGPDAQLWLGVRRLWLTAADGGGGRFYGVEGSRAYRDRLVLKLEGVEDGNAAARLAGHAVFVAESEAPRPPSGVYHRAQLVGFDVEDARSGTLLGQVQDVIPTRGHDLLQIRRSGGGSDRELLLPLSREHVLEVQLEERRMKVRLPEGLDEL